MKKLIYSLLTLAAALSLASCQPDKLLNGKDTYGDGTVDATFSVTLGPATKAFADGTTVDQLYAGLYEMGANDAYTWVADNSTAPIAINAKTATVTFNGKIELGKEYLVVFWAQKASDGNTYTSPYSIDWAKSVTTGPTVTATATGAANVENRDAFYGKYETGAVTGSIDLTNSPITLKRPFAQVNVLVPIANFTDATAAVYSSMTVAQAPTVLNLATKATSDPADWTFSSAAIAEAAFGSYSSKHKYVAMNYVLVDQTAADPRYDVTFSVTSGSQVAADKQVKNTPLKPNGRTNIVGNIFDANFNITVPIVIDPGAGSEQEITQVTVSVGQTEAEAVELTFDPTNPTTSSIEIAVSHPVEVEADKPQITVEPAAVATAEWNLTTGKLDVTPLVANGAAVITLVFPAVTKTEYSAATVQVYVKVGSGENVAATPTFSPAAGEVAQGTQVTITSTTEGASIYYTTNGDEPTNASTLYEDPIVINSACTIKAIAIKDGFSNSAVAEAAYTLAPLPKLSAPSQPAISISEETGLMTGSWSAVENATSYTVTLHKFPGSAANSWPAVDNTATEVLSTNALQYSYDLNAINGAGVGGYYVEVVAHADNYQDSDATASGSSYFYNLKSVAVTTNPTTTAYTAGQTLSLDGMVVKVYHAGDNTGEVVTNYTTVPAAGTALTEQNNQITVNYSVSIAGTDPAQTRTVSTTVPITVNAAPAPDFTTIAELKALTFSTATDYTGTLTGAVVSFVGGDKDAVIKDATGSILYHKEAGHSLLQGQTIDGEVAVKTGQYNGGKQITALTATASGTETTVAPAAVPLADIVANFSDYECAYVSVAGLNVTAVSGKNVTVSNGTDSYLVYNNPGNATCNVGDVITAVGTVTINNGTKEIKVWKAADLTVTQAAPVLSATPATKTVNASDTEVIWTITSNTDWTIAADAGVTATPPTGTGNGTVELSFAANTGTESRQLSATVSAYGCTDVTITITQNGTGNTTKTIEFTYADYLSKIVTGTGTNYASVSTSADGVTITFNKLTGGTNPTVNTNSNELRLYAKGSVCVSGKTIKEIVYTYVVNPNKNGDSPTVGSVSGATNNGTWIADTNTWSDNTGDSSVTMTLGGTAGNFGFTSIQVTYSD